MNVWLAIIQKSVVRVKCMYMGLDGEGKSYYVYVRKGLNFYILNTSKHKAFLYWASTSTYSIKT